MLAKLAKSGACRLPALESVRPLREFDVVGFSLQFAQPYTNVLLMIDRGSIPLRSVDRGEGDPLVVAGGPVATHAEAMAPFFDAILVGDGEEAAKEMLLSWTDGKRAGQDSARTPRGPGPDHRRAHVPSLYVHGDRFDTGLPRRLEADGAGPSGRLPPFPIERRLVPDLNQYPFPTTRSP